ncbi:MAG: chalcone isomerase family protein [Gammaproteobacteria bacterium]|nr:chalcone isomerase family protein [Gammaproteobacteria bacterium]
MPKLIIVFLISLLPSQLLARDVAGVDIAEQLTITPGNHIFLNGAGVRSKFVFDIYVGALYLKKPSKDINEILNMDGPKRILMHFVYDEVEKEKLTDGWIDGFKNNNSAEQFAQLNERLQKFNSYFITVKKNDVIMLDYIPGVGTEIHINNDVKGSIPGQDFYHALLKVWLGEIPADPELKKAMLGITASE